MSCSVVPTPNRPITIPALVDLYFTYEYPVVKRQRNAMALGTLDNAICLIAENRSKALHHGRWSENAPIVGPLKQALRSEAANMKLCKTFDQLFQLVVRIAGRVRGLDARGVVVYDIAVLLGYRLGLEPEELYLHDGAKLGCDLLMAHRQHIEYLNSRLDYARQEDVLCLLHNLHSKGLVVL